MKPNCKLTLAERKEIELGISQGISGAAIARKIGRGKNTVVYEN